jgi:hypothetical protein
MAEIRNNQYAQVVAKLTSLVGVPCVVRSSNLGQVPGVIKEIAFVGEATDFDQSFNLSEFTVLLESGTTLRVSVSDITIDHTP